MKKYLLAGVALLAAATAAGAADLPRKSPPPAPVRSYVAPAFTWTGFYAGLNAGYGFSASDRVNYTGGPGYAALIAAGAVPAGYKLERNGFVGGGQVGYNMQYGQFVYGLEGDIQFTDLSKRQTVATAFSTGTARAETNYLGTLRGRIGFTPVDRTLLYVTGGLAVGNTKLSNSVTGVGAYSASKDETSAGYVLGAGVEYAFTNNWTAKAEYLYYDLGDQKLNGTSGALPVTLKTENRGSIARLGVNYKF